MIDNTTLQNSWRCSKAICNNISDNIGIEIPSNRSKEDDTSIKFIDDEETIASMLADVNVIKLHYQNSAKFGCCHKNRGGTKYVAIT